MDIKNEYRDIVLNSGLSREDKIDHLFYAESNITTSLKLIFNVILFVKDTLYPFLYNRVYYSNYKQSVVSEFKSRYDELVSEFEAIKNSPTSTEEDKIVLFNKITTLKDDLNRFKNDNVVRPPVKQPTVDTEPSVSYGGAYVGDVTSKIDELANDKWRAYWKTRCGSYTGKELNRCKARGVDLAINLINVRMSNCNQTVDPLGCKNTLNRMIARWKDRKVGYLIKR